MKTIDVLLSNVEYSVTDSTTHNVRFCMPKGTRYRIVWETEDGRTYSGGTFINISHNNLTFPIGSRTRYATYSDAFKVAEIWNTLIQNSTTTWKQCFNKFYIIDTEVTPIEKTGTFNVKILDKSNIVALF